MGTNNPVNEDSMNWQDYRLSLSRMKYIAETSNHFQATYNFPTEGQPKQICCCRRPRLLKLPIETLMTYANIGVREPIFTKHRRTQTFLLNQKSSARTDGFSSFKCDSARKYSIIVHYYTLTMVACNQSQENQMIKMTKTWRPCWMN